MFSCKNYCSFICSLISLDVGNPVLSEIRYPDIPVGLEPIAHMNKVIWTLELDPAGS